MRGKQGLSTVVTTLIIILLVLVAIGIIWVVVKGVITGSGEQIDINTKCVTTNLEIDSASCSAATDICTVTVDKVGGYALNGVNIVFSNAAGSGASIPQSGDIVVSKTFPSLPSGIVIASGDSVNVKVAGYFNNAEGTPISCPGISELDITAGT